MMQMPPLGPLSPRFPKIKLLLSQVVFFDVILIVFVGLDFNMSILYVTTMLHGCSVWCLPNVTSSLIRTKNLDLKCSRDLCSLCSLIKL